MATDLFCRESVKGGPVHLGKYQILGHLGAGGMGAVYKALDPDNNRQVALKVLAPEGIAGRPALLERFRREALHGAKLRHENIVQIYEFGEAGGAYYLVMELVEGTNLHEHVNEHGPLEPERARRVVLQVAAALDHAFQQGIVHRDIKPANILLSEKDGKTVAKLVDLGLARTNREDELRLTREGHTVGTVDFMSPEQARDSASADVRSDIYSLGCTLFHMLTGAPPFADGSLPERLYKHAEAEPPDVREQNPAVSPELAAVLQRMLAKKPADRPQTPAELLALLRVAACHPSKPAPRPVATPRRQQAAKTLIGDGRPGATSTSWELKRPPGPAEKKAPTTPTDVPAAVAAGQFAWAKQQLARGNVEYGIELLLACCKRDPGNLGYHQALCESRKARPAGGAGGWKARWRGLTSKLKLKLARRGQQHLQVLLHAEEVLAYSGPDPELPVVMAEAGQELGLEELALWLLQQACADDRNNVPVLRALALLYESQKKIAEALTCWKKVERRVPNDTEARRKLCDLSALDTLQKNRQKYVPGAAPDSSDV
jgi:serine/threonine protein kinase